MKVLRRTALVLGLAALILSLAAWARGLWGTGVRVDISSARRQLVEAVGAVRPSEGRLIGGFSYARFVPDSAPVKSDRELKEAREQIESALKREGSPQSFADAGVLNLLGGQLDRAVAFLERAAKRDSTSAAIWSDLAAAYLARFEKGSSFTDLLDALDAAEQAVEADPTLSEAQFNLASALDRFSLRSRARAAWSRYRGLDGNSEWSHEAESRFADLFQPSYSDLWSEHRVAFEQAHPLQLGESARKLAQLFPQQAREMVEEDLLGRWAVEMSRGRVRDAARMLTLAESLGTVLAARGERMSYRSVQVIRVASAAPGGAPILSRLAEGHLQYTKGLDQYRSFSLGAAVPLLNAARKALAEADSPFELWAQFQLAVCETQLYDYESALFRLENLLRSRDIAAYPALRARALWVSGLVHGYRGAPAETLAAYREALDIFDGLGEEENRTVVANLLAEVHRHLDDLPGAWKFHGMALEGLESISNKDKRWPVLAELGVSLLAADRARLSLYVQEELLRGHMGPIKPERLVGGLRRMAEAQYRNGDLQKALSLTRQAKREARRVSEARLREGLFGDLLTLEGRIKTEVAPREAVHLLSAAIHSDERTQNRLRLVRSLFERARLLRKERSFRLAEKSLLKAIHQLQGYRPAEDLLAASFEQVRQVYGEMVHLQALQGRHGAALQFAEQGRAQVLSLMAPADIPAIPVFTLEQIQKEMPPNTALVEWWIGEKEIFSWTIRRDSFSFLSRPIDSGRLHRATLRFRKAASADDLATAASMASWLYGILLAPSESSLGGVERLVLIPDQSLYALPFATLQRSTGAKYLIEEMALSVAPSASLYLQCFRRARELAHLELSVVAFGNPSFDRSVFSALTALPRAEVEAEQVVDAYPKGVLVLGSEVTRWRMLTEASNWPVLHIGGHVVANAVNPFASALALASSKGDNGVLYFQDLAKAGLHRTRLIVLSACSSLLGESGVGAKIAEPLLAQGVPAVLGTLWSVRDFEAQRVAIDFHRRFAESHDAMEALREAQLVLLREPGLRYRPSTWAGFELMGSY